MKRLLLLVVCAVVVVILNDGSLLAQSRIIHDRYTDSSTYVDPTLCPFEVVVSGSSNIDDMYVFNDEGKVERLLVTVNHAVITYSANGKTLTARGSGGIEYTVNPDRSVTAQTFGINLLLTIPGYGNVILDTGRAEYLFDPHIHEVFHAGPAIYDTSAFCGALS